MKVSVEDVNTVKKILHVEVPRETVGQELNEAYGTLKKTAKIKGFRPGKAPRSVLERLFKKDVHSDITSKLMQSSFIEALKETGLNIIGTPQIDPPDLKADEPYQYDATVEISPVIDTIDFKGLTLKKNMYKATDVEMDTQIKILQKNLAQRTPIEEQRPVQDGDFVLIDYEGFKDGNPFEETEKTENFLMQIGRGTISKDLDPEIIGMVPDESKEISVAFAEDHPNTKLAGLELTFAVKLNEIREEVLPELDDAFAKRLGEFNTLDDLKKEITSNLKQGYDKRSEHELNEQIFKALIEKTDFELPDTLVEMELDGILNEAERSYSAQGMSLEEAGITRENLSDNHRGTAEKQVRRHLILNKIVEQEKLTLSDEDLEKGYVEMAASARQDLEFIRDYYGKNPEGLDFFKHTLLEKQAISLMIEQNTVEEIVPEIEQAEPEKKG